MKTNQNNPGTTETDQETLKSAIENLVKTFDGILLKDGLYYLVNGNLKANFMPSKYQEVVIIYDVSEIPDRRFGRHEIFRIFFKDADNGNKFIELINKGGYYHDNIKSSF